MEFAKKNLSADGLLELVRIALKEKQIRDKPNVKYSTLDCIMSGLAVFGFKFASLLQFEKSKNSDNIIKRNLKSLYGIEEVPSDTCLRERLDRIDPRILRAVFKKIFTLLQRTKVLEQYKYLDEGYIISVDGTGQYSSQNISCKNCCEKHHRNGSKTFYHHMLGAVVVSPEIKQVIPLAPEPIVKGDGDTKNDCERNASTRLLNDFRKDHPHLKVVVVEDSLSSNFPHLSLLDSLDMSYIIGAKSGDHVYLFDWIKDLKHKELKVTDSSGVTHKIKYYKNVPLNEKNHDYRVNVLDCESTSPKGKLHHFTWVTNIKITEDNAYKLMLAARSRWRIENETFNTLKNQGYNFEHNYGHGYDNLCSVMTMLMMLAFLIDQIQQLCCARFQAAKQHSGAFKVLFEYIRYCTSMFCFSCYADLYRFISLPNERPPPDANWNIIFP